MLEGSGFISRDLARLLPRRVAQGRVLSPAPCALPSSAAPSLLLLPYAYQVRVFSSLLGVFKGTLVVDPSLPPRSLRLRASMRKVERPGGVLPTCNMNRNSSSSSISRSSSSGVAETGPSASLVAVEVVNTAGNTDQVSAAAAPLTPQQLSGPDSTTAAEGEALASHNGKLNRFLILLLHANGVSEHIFQDLARYLTLPAVAIDLQL